MAQAVGEVGTHHARVVAGDEVDAGAVQGDGDGLRQKGAVVAGAVPGHAAFVAGGEPEFAQEVDRRGGLRAVQGHAAVFVHFLAPETPQEGVGETRRIAEGVRQGLPHRHAGALELPAGFQVLVPGLGRARDADLREDVLAIHVGGAAEEIGHAAVHAAGVAHGVADERIDVVAAQLVDQVVVVLQPVGVQQRIIGVELQDVRSRAALDRRGGARRQVVGVDVLDGHPHARLLAERRGLAVPLHVGGGDETAPFQDVQGALPGKRRGGARQPRRAGRSRQYGSRPSRLRQTIRVACGGPVRPAAPRPRRCSCVASKGAAAPEKPSRCMPAGGVARR